MTSAISEYDAAKLLGLSDDEYADQMHDRAVVAKGHDFEWAGLRVQVKANRPSGRRGSTVTLVAKPKNYDWDVLVWLLYDSAYQLQEAWRWDVADYRQQFEFKKRISPDDMRRGKQLGVESAPRDVSAPATPDVR
ncbi:MAG: hypothetical protein ACKVX7_14865 [Planctomycetota bacterium]